MTAPASTTLSSASEPSRAWPVLRLVPWILGFAFCLLLIQHGVQDGRQVYLAAGLVVLAVGGAGLCWRARFGVPNALSSVPFAVALLTIIAVATALGTFVPQNSPADFLEKHYGEPAAFCIGWLFLNDTFHSYWFAGLLSLLVLSLLVTVLRRPFWRLFYWGFLLGHGGMVVVVAGAAIGARFGTHGTLALRKGVESTAFTRSGGEKESQPIALGFGLRLDAFEVEMYPDELRLVLYRTKEEPPPDLLGAFRLEVTKGWTALPESGFYFRVREFSLGAGEAKPGRHLIEVPGAPEPLEVEVGKTCTLPGTKRSFRVAEFYPDFSFSIEEKRAFSLSDEPRNPVLLIEEPGAGKDGAPRKQWLFARNPGHGPGDKDLPLKYTYTGSGGLPSATVEIRKGRAKASIVETTMTPGEGKDAVFWLDDECALVFEKKAGEPRAYRSKVSVLDGGKVTKEATIAVNAPLSYGGYDFYQSDWRSEDLSYSGIKVVRDPGLGLVYAGMIMLSAGVLFVFYIRPRVRTAGIGAAGVEPRLNAGGRAATKADGEEVNR